MIKLLKTLRRTDATPLYTIGAASSLSGMPIWTLRWVEKHGLVSPQRTRGRHRLFSGKEIERLREIRQFLAGKVNLAGIRVILRMRRGTTGRA